MKKKYKKMFFAYIYSRGRSVRFFAIKYTVNHVNLVSEAIGIINTVSAIAAELPSFGGGGGGGGGG